MEKSKLLTFIFALVPGMGHMYVGMMKKGVSLMAAFLAPMALIFLTRGFEVIGFLLPIVWCYSFFDAFRCRVYPKPVREQMDDDFYCWLKKFWLEDLEPMLLRRRKLVGLFCIFLAIYTFIYNIFGSLLNWFGGVFWFFYAALSKVPTLLVVLFLLKLGVDLLQQEEDEFVAYQKPSEPQEEETVSFFEETEEMPETEEAEEQDIAEEEVLQAPQKEETGTVVEPVFLEKRVE